MGDPIRVRGDVSSQFLTALLMALPLARATDADMVIEVQGELISKPYIEITLNMMAALRRRGSAAKAGSRFVIPKPAARYTHPGQSSMWKAMPRRPRTSWQLGAIAATWGTLRCASKVSVHRLDPG